MQNTVKFNLKKALSNPELVVYRNGEKPKEWHWFRTADQTAEPILSVDMEGCVIYHTKNGCFAYDDGDPNSYDLLLLCPSPKRKPAKKK